MKFQQWSLNSILVIFLTGYAGLAEAALPFVISSSTPSLQVKQNNTASSIEQALEIADQAAMHYANGAYPKAESLYEQALEIVLNHNDYSGILAVSNNLALSYQRQGRLEEAIDLLQEILDLAIKELGQTHSDVGQILVNLGELYHDQGRYEDAESYYQRGLGIYRNDSGNNDLRIAQALNNLSGLYRRAKDFERAAPLLQEALNIFRSQLGDSHRYVAVSLTNLASLYSDFGRYEDAELYLKQARDIYINQPGSQHPELSQIQDFLVRLYQKQNRYVEAMEELEHGLAVEEHNLKLNLLVLADSQRQKYIRRRLTQLLNQAISLSVSAGEQLPETIEVALTAVLQRKGRLIDMSANSLKSLRQNLNADEQRRLDDLANLHRQLSTLTFNPSEEYSPQQLQREIEAVEKEILIKQEGLARRSAIFQAATEPVALSAVAAKIPPNTALVEYVRYRRSGSYRLSLTHPNGRARVSAGLRAYYAAYVVSSDGSVSVFDLGDADRIDQAVSALRTSLESAETALFEVHEDAQALYGYLLEPLQDAIGTPQKLLISPDANLNLIPFEVLRSDNEKYLVEDFRISYLNSGRDLLDLNVVPPSSQQSIVVANPNYGALQVSQTYSDRNSKNLRSGAMSGIQATPLKWTLEEGSAIADQLDVSLTAGTQATETFLKKVQSPQILHIATHGFFLENTPLFQAANESNITGSPNPSITTSSTFPSENPLLRSGLALEGFNKRKSGPDDGVLTALEASEINLYGTQLVVLSACDTGIGEVPQGEGVYGLRRAFEIAGAESLLMSLWQVDDLRTQKLMVGFYKNLLDINEIDRSDALRESQLNMIRSGQGDAHPYYWAAFILSGNWRPLTLD